MKRTLKKNYEFKQVLIKGEYYTGKYITIYIKKNKKEENFLGIAISSKICKAVKRNKIKRLIRESYKLLREKLKKGNDIVIIWNKKVPIDMAIFENIYIDMVKIFNRAGMNNL